MPFHLVGRLLPEIVRPRAATEADLVPGALAVRLVDAKTREEVPFDGALLSGAVENLRELSRPQEWQTLRGTHLRAWVDADGFAASRVLLIREILRPWTVGGALLAVPGPDRLVAMPIGRGRDLDDLAALVAIAGTGSLSTDLFWHDGVEIHRIPVTHGDRPEVHPIPELAERLVLLTAPRAVAAEA